MGHAFQTAEKSPSRSQSGSSNRGLAIMRKLAPENQSLLQRKTDRCACGGGCPRCQSKIPIHTKLAISQPGDPYEQEADRVAEQVMLMSAPTLQRACAACSSGGAPGPKCEAENEGLVQRKAEGGSDSVSDDFLHNLGSGRPLDPASRGFMESRFSHDFGRVRVHTDAQAAELAQGVNALAYSVGQDIVFGTGQYAPGTPRPSKAQPRVVVSSRLETSVLALQRTIGNQAVNRAIQPEGANLPPSVQSVLGAGGQPLDAGTRASMESRFGSDFSQVRVHTDAHAAGSANAVRADAYTVGSDVVFGANQYAPATLAGKHLLAHELAHVVQQSRGGAGASFNPSSRSMERAAHAAGVAATSGSGHIHVAGASAPGLAKQDKRPALVEKDQEWYHGRLQANRANYKKAGEPPGWPYDPHLSALWDATKPLWGTNAEGNFGAHKEVRAFVDAVRTYQRTQEIDTTQGGEGIVGPRTLKVLRPEAASQPAPSAKASEPSDKPYSPLDDPSILWIGPFEVLPDDPEKLAEHQKTQQQLAEEVGEHIEAWVLEQMKLAIDTYAGAFIGFRTVTNDLRKEIEETRARGLMWSDVRGIDVAGAKYTADWNPALDYLKEARGDVSKWIGKAIKRAAKAYAQSDKKAQATALMALEGELVRIGQALRIIGMYLAAIRAAQYALHDAPGYVTGELGFNNAMIDRADELHGLLEQLRSGQRSAAAMTPGIDAAVSLTQAEIERFYKGLEDGVKLLQVAEVIGIITSVIGIGTALAGIARLLAGAALTGGGGLALAGAAAGGGLRAGGVAAAGSLEAILQGIKIASAGTVMMMAGGKASTDLGKQGEAAVGIQGSKQRIPSLTKTTKSGFRIPDELKVLTLEEVKNTAGISLTRQLRDFLLYSQKTGRTFTLWVRQATWNNMKLTRPVQDLVDQGLIVIGIIP